MLSGGGGGRPGSRPFLNWKQKRELLAREEQRKQQEAEDADRRQSDADSELLLGDEGYFEDLEAHVDLSKAEVINLSKMDVYEEPQDLRAQLAEKAERDRKAAEEAALSNPEKKKKKKHPKGPRSHVLPHLLFGSHKSEGYMIPSKTAPEKVRFSHRRVFGHKFKKEVDAAE